MAMGPRPEAKVPTGPQPMTTRCTSHCSNCGLHFHSLEAFDAHRTGSHTEGRYCLHPYDLDGKLTPLTTTGDCRMYDPAQAGVTVWHNPTRAAQTRAHFANERSTGPRHLSASEGKPTSRTDFASNSPHGASARPSEGVCTAKLGLPSTHDHRCSQRKDSPRWGGCATGTFPGTVRRTGFDG
jgi:hypothetical protein